MTEPVGAQGWIELFRSLGQSLLEVLRAEARALGADFRRSGYQLARGLALLIGAGAVLYWTLGVLVLALIALLALWLPVWAAALAVAALFALTAGLLAALGLRQLRRLESPADDIKRRVSDHLDWWQNRLLADPAALPPPLSPRTPPTPRAAPAGAARDDGPLLPPTSPPRIRPDDPLEEDEP